MNTKTSELIIKRTNSILLLVHISITIQMKKREPLNLEYQLTQFFLVREQTRVS